jgi:hypothetical protein
MHVARIGAMIFLLSGLAGCGGGAASSAPPAPAKVAPVAAAGPAQTVELGATVTLDGSASSGADGARLSYNWTLDAKPAGSNAVLAAATSAHPTFMPDVEGSYSISLVVNDGKSNSIAARATITVARAPAAPITIPSGGGGARTIAAGTTTSLGLPAWDFANGDHLRYSWILASKPTDSSAVLASAEAAQASLTPDLPGNYIASLVVSDGARQSMPAASAITALDPAVFNSFVAMVNHRLCNDLASELYLIDGQYVFSYVASTCGDAAYDAQLYSLTIHEVC